MQALRAGSRCCCAAAAATSSRRLNHQRRLSPAPIRQPLRIAAAAAPADEAEADEEALAGPLPELSAARHVIVEGAFTGSADELRGVFDGRFEDPRATTRERFLWDYWFVENQYTLMRTQVGEPQQRSVTTGGALPSLRPEMFL